VYECTPESLNAALEYLKRSLAIDPHYAPAMALTEMGWIEAIGGDKEKALQLLTQARRLSPRDRSAWFTFGDLERVAWRLISRL
jgi:tetratricopeptide (TPR) repeat protein